eukprot:29729-Pelagococcus_subviridis.AAC.4
MASSFAATVSERRSIAVAPVSHMTSTARRGRGARTSARGDRVYTRTRTVATIQLERSRRVTPFRKRRGSAAREAEESRRAG